MEDRRWTREELGALARGRWVLGRNLQAGDIDPPEWLVACSTGRWPYDSATSLEQLHPEDRELLIGAFLTSTVSPGEPVRVLTRTRSLGYWHHAESIWLNLVDHEDVGMIISFGGEVDGPPFEPPEEVAVGDHAPTRWMLWTLSDTGVLTSVEGASLELLGYEPHELVGRHASEFLPADTVADGIAMWVELHQKPGNTATSRRHWVRRDGSRIWMEDSYLNRSGPGSALAVLWDATDRMIQEQELRDRQSELIAREAEKSSLAAQMQALAGDFQLLADEVPAVVFRCDAAGTVLFHNARWTELVGDQAGVTRLHDIVAPAAHAELDRVLAELVHADTAQRRSLEVAAGVSADTDGRVWRVSLRGTGDGQAGRSLVGSIEDVSATVQLRRDALQDPLTGLLNRTAFHAHLGEALHADPADVLVFFIDLDGFKRVNDTWGHEAGDAVLAEVARRLRVGLRPEDVIGRYGGDEFVVGCSHAPTTEPATIVDRLTLALAGDIVFAGGTWTPAASIGWARGEAGDDIASVIRRADLGMYEHKRGRLSSP
jgi:diguanylate cyclase (GGDEF)-like protein/PAS domain S-box-containing protein